MSELRFQPFLNEWVIVATHRQERTFFPSDDYCPLCPTKNKDFPTEIPFDDYEIAVFENKFPSLRTPPEKPVVNGSDIFPVAPSEGVCEVICYTSDHNKTMADLSENHIRKIVYVWRDRYEELISRPEVKYVYIFENKGKEIGVTLSHPHGQIYAYSFVPFKIQSRLKNEEIYFMENKRKLAKEWINYEIKEDRRIIWKGEYWVAVVPFFARYPFEIQIVPFSFSENILSLNKNELHELAIAIKVITVKLDKLFGFSMPYIMSMYQAEIPATSFCLEFTPPYRAKDKLKFLAGSESGCGVFINDTLPEETAEILKTL